MDTRIATIARAALLEAIRTRLVHLVAGLALAMLATAFFVESLAIAERARHFTAFYAAGMRLACVFVAGFFVLASIAREFNDKVLEMLLALDVPRSHYVLGKLAGFLAVALLIAVVASVPIAATSGPGAVAQWTISLAVELGVMSAVALFCVVTFTQFLPAASFVLGFYVLARSLAAIRLIAEHPIAGADSPFHVLMQWLFDALALVLPALDAWTQTAWLVNEPARWERILGIAGEGMLYVALLAAATMFDFYRRNF